MAEATITGDAILDRKLSLMPGKLSAALRKGTRAGAKVVLEDARRYAPEDTGLLRSQLTVRTAKSARGGRLPRGVVGHAVLLRPKTGAHDDTWYGSFVELGTKYIEAREFMQEASIVNEARVVRANRQAVQEFVRQQRIR